MLHWILVGATGLIGTLGIAGALAVIAGVCTIGPAAVSAIVQPIFARFIACATCVALAAATLSTVGAYWVGHHQAVVECRKADLEAELRNREIDLENASKARSDETERANKIEGDSSEQHKTDLALIAKLKDRPATCMFDASDAGLPDDKSGTGGANAPASAGKAGANIASPVPHKRLLLPVVRDSWMPWRGRKSNAPPHQ